MQKKPKQVKLLPKLGDDPMAVLVEEEYRVNWKEELERRANPGGSMYKFFSSMWDERDEIDAEFLIVFELLTKKLDKLEKWEVSLEKSQATDEEEIFTQTETVELSITGAENMKNSSDGSQSKGSNRSATSEANLTAHSRIALLRMFMLKKQLSQLQQQQDSFGRNWLLPFNEKNQFHVT